MRDKAPDKHVIIDCRMKNREPKTGGGGDVQSRPGRILFAARRYLLETLGHRLLRRQVPDFLLVS